MLRYASQQFTVYSLQFTQASRRLWTVDCGLWTFATEGAI